MADLPELCVSTSVLPWLSIADVEESRGLPDWPKRYYGSNYPRLQQLKALYDPTDRFTCASLSSVHVY